MPICEADPWRLQYFAAVACPPEVKIPTEDSDAWEWNPAARWVYDKLAVAFSQGLDAGPHGTQPPRFPVFSKPIYNMKGMGVDTRLMRSARDYARYQRAGHMWMTYLEGRHVSSDVAVVKGKARWWRHVTAKPGPRGTFDYWAVHAAADAEIEGRCGDWIARHLPSYTGIINMETIAGTIIEVHLRISDQWPDLYGAGWVEALVGLYDSGAWSFGDDDRRDGFSVVLFGRKGVRYRHPPAQAVAGILGRRGVSSVQITFHENLAPARHVMPPGGFRLAIVNCWDLDVGLKAREDLKAHFPGAYDMAAPEI
jgi:hypothetical protein